MILQQTGGKILRRPLLGQQVKLEYEWQIKVFISMLNVLALLMYCGYVREYLY